MRYATENTTGNTCYSNLLDNCKHSRLRAALGGPVAPATSARRPLVPAQAPVLVTESTKAYLWVTGMSVVSLLGVLVTGTINA